MRELMEYAGLFKQIQPKRMDANKVELPGGWLASFRLDWRVEITELVFL